MFLLAAAFLGSVLALQPAWHNQDSWKKDSYNFTYDAASHHASHRGSPKSSIDEPVVHDIRDNQYFQINFRGVVNVLESKVQLFYRHAQVDERSIEVSLQRGSSVLARCSNLERFVNVISFDLVGCVGSALDTTGAYTWVVSGALRNGGSAVKEEFPLHRYALPKYPWPLPNDDEAWPPRQPNLAGNIVENYQSFSGANGAYWHEGLDIMSPLLGDNLGQAVHAPAAGRVVNIVRYGASDLYWSLMVEDGNEFVWQFHHIDPRTFTVRIGDTVSQGQVLGRIARWTARWNGNLYHHVHQNLCRYHPSWTRVPNPYVDGWQYFNSINFYDNGGYTGGSDSRPRTDGVMFFLPNEQNTAFASSADAATPVVSGAVDIVLQWHSNWAPTNRIPGHPYPNGLYEVGYSVAPAGEAGEAANATYALRGSDPRVPLILSSKQPNEWAFCLPALRTSCADAMLRRVYRQQFSYQGRTYRSVFDYNTRALYYTLTNTQFGQPDAANGFWATNERLFDGTPRYANGDYLVTGYACDVYRNCEQVTHRVTVRN